MNPLLFKALKVLNWRQFGRVEVDLHRRLTVLTGANGAGKTTLLNIFSRHFNWHTDLVATPMRFKGAPSTQYFSDYWTPEAFKRMQDWDDEPDAGPIPEPPQPSVHEIGTLSYTNDVQASLRLPVTTTPTYQIAVHQQQAVRGFHVPSHRPRYAYQPLSQIQATPRLREQLFSQYHSIVQTRFLGGHAQWTPNFFIKETIVSLAMFGYGNQVVEPNEGARQLYEEFQDVLRLVLPQTLGFQKLAVRMPEVVLVTKSGSFSLDAVSGGVAAIVDLAWQLFMFAPRESAFVVTIDEPENHLHPELQRTLLPSLLQTFPSAQFVVATHSPFIVGAVPDANVYALTYDMNRRVVSHFLQDVDRSGSSNDILRDVLGLESTMPVWVQRYLEDALREIDGPDVTPEALQRLKTRLAEAGLQRYFATSLVSIAGRGGKE